MLLHTAAFSWTLSRSHTTDLTTQRIPKPRNLVHFLASFLRRFGLLVSDSFTTSARCCISCRRAGFPLPRPALAGFAATYCAHTGFFSFCFSFGYGPFLWFHLPRLVPPAATTDALLPPHRFSLPSRSIRLLTPQDYSFGHHATYLLTVRDYVLLLHRRISLVYGSRWDGFFSFHVIRKVISSANTLSFLRTCWFAWVTLPGSCSSALFFSPSPFHALDSPCTAPYTAAPPAHHFSLRCAGTCTVSATFRHDLFAPAICGFSPQHALLSA